MSTANPNKYVEIDIRDIISSAKMELNIDNMDNDLYFLKLANEGIRQLDCLSIFTKQCKVLPICDNKVKLPCGFNQFIGLYYSDLDGRSINNGLLYFDTSLLNQNNIAYPQNGYFVNYNGSFQIVGDYIIFGSSVQHDSVSLIYFGLNVDEDGFMKVYDYYERALTAYICYKYARQNFKEYGQYIIEDFKKEWTAQKNYVKGCDAVDFAKNNMWELKRMFNAWMINQNSQQYNFNSVAY